MLPALKLAIVYEDAYFCLSKRTEQTHFIHFEVLGWLQNRAVF